MAGDREMVYECTSANFDGCGLLPSNPHGHVTDAPLPARALRRMVAMMKPHESWVARWQGITNWVPGCYALRVKGTLRSEHIVTLEENGIRYKPLDEDEPS
jgi:hypothetical protein